jgi:plasmid stability protein
MGQLTIRDVDHALLVQLKRKAWQEGLPLEAFLRRLLLASVETEDLDLPTASYPARFAVPAGPTRMAHFSRVTAAG